MTDNIGFTRKMTAMKVLHVYRTYFPDTQGGGEEVVRQICLNTRQFGVSSRVFVPSPAPEPAVIDSEEGRIVRVKRQFEIASCGFCLTGFPEFRRQVEWADVVHYHFPWPFADLLHFFGGVRRPSLATYHSDIVRQKLLGAFYRPAMHGFLRSLGKIVATSPNYAASSEVLQKYHDKVEVVPIGLDESSYPVVQKSEPLIDEVKSLVGEGFFLFVGVLRYYKGVEILLQASQDAAFRVVIAGSGPLEAELRTNAQAMGLSNVQFLGYVSDEWKVALFHLACAVVMPSPFRSEAFGVTLLEGAMFSKALISAETGTGSIFVNRHNETGQVVPAGCAITLRKAMEQLYFNPDEAERMGVKARRHYEQQFTGRSMGEAYTRIYRELLGSPDDESVSAEAAARSSRCE